MKPAWRASSLLMNPKSSRDVYKRQLKDNQLGPVAPRSDKQFLEMLGVIVPPDLLLAAGATYALDH